MLARGLDVDAVRREEILHRGDERALLIRNVASEAAEKEEASVLSVMGSGRVWLMAAIYFGFVMGLYGTSFWQPTIIRALGFEDTFEIGLISAIPYSVAVVAMLAAARKRLDL